MSLAVFAPKTTFGRTFSLPRLRTVVRAYASATSTPGQPAKGSSEPTKHVTSACLPDTVMTGLNYLKGESPVLAKSDEDYPAWLWDLLKPKTTLADGVDDGSGGKAEKRRLRMQHRQALKDSNLFKSK